MDITQLIIQMIIGGNMAGGALKNYSLGTAGNTIAGIVGGGLGGKFSACFLAVRSRQRTRLPRRAA